MGGSSRRPFVLAALAAGVALAGCASSSVPRDPYAGYRDPYAYGAYGHDGYYRGTDYIVVDPYADRLERHQAEERKDLNQDQNAEKRDLKQQQEQERQALRRADEWDEQDRLEQESERKQQKRVFKQEDRALREQQREEWPY